MSLQPICLLSAARYCLHLLLPGRRLTTAGGRRRWTCGSPSGYGRYFIQKDVTGASFVHRAVEGLLFLLRGGTVSSFVGERRLLSAGANGRSMPPQEPASLPVPDHGHIISPPPAGENCGVLSSCQANRLAAWFLLLLLAGGRRGGAGGGVCRLLPACAPPRAATSLTFFSQPRLLRHFSILLVAPRGRSLWWTE